jgi:hypothetical protein
MECLAPNDQLIYMTYFNAGLQIFDVRDPRDPHIVGYYIPDDPKERRGPVPSTLVHQAQELLVGQTRCDPHVRRQQRHLLLAQQNQ